VRTVWISVRGRARVFVVTLSCTLGACAAASPRGAARAERPERSGAPSGGKCDVARDRAAIRGMAGAFRVSFAFDETEALAPGYTLRPAYRADAAEVVELLEETDRKLVLQHVLVLTGSDGVASPLKHWRQDWTFEDTDLVEFEGNGTFEHRTLSPAEVRCTWSQAVFEVDDAPRYESFGRWAHQGETSSWTSAETWRPLPRREYTKRSDYDVLVATNRHVVTPSGWAHEQDNVKLVLDGRRALVRERGLNRYERTELAPAAVARAYLRNTAEFWRGVRAHWARAIERSSRFEVEAEHERRPRYEGLFELAGQGEPVEQRLARARALINEVVHAGAQAAGTAPQTRAARGETHP